MYTSRHDIHSRPRKRTFWPRDLENWPMTVIFELDVDSAKLNRRVKYPVIAHLVRTLFIQTHAHIWPIALFGPLDWSVIIRRSVQWPLMLHLVHREGYWVGRQQGYSNSYCTAVAIQQKRVKVIPHLRRSSDSNRATGTSHRDEWVRLSCPVMWNGLKRVSEPRLTAIVRHTIGHFQDASFRVTDYTVTDSHNNRNIFSKYKI